MYEKFEIIYYFIVDYDGNVVFIIYMVNGCFGVVVIVLGIGFFLNDEMDDFIVKVGE